MRKKKRKKKKKTHLGLTNYTFCLLSVRLDHFEEYLKVSSREVDSKTHRMII